MRTLYYGEGGSTWVGELTYGEDKTILAINIGDETADVPLPPGPLPDPDRGHRRQHGHISPAAQSGGLFLGSKQHGTESETGTQA